MDRVRTSRVGRLQELGQILLEHQASLCDFLTHDPRGVRIFPYLAKLSEHLLQERDETTKETEGPGTTCGPYQRNRRRMQGEAMPGPRADTGEGARGILN